MSKKSTSSNITSDNATTSTSSNVQSTADSGSGSLYDTNIQVNQQHQDVADSINRSLDQTKK